MKKGITKLLFYTILVLLSTLYSCRKSGNITSINDNGSIKTDKYDNISIKKSIQDISRAKDLNNKKLLGSIYFEVGYYYLKNNKNDSAFLYFYHSKEMFSIIKDTLFTGRNMLYIATIQKNEGDYYGSEETIVEALKYLNSKENIYTAPLYNCLAMSKMEQKNYSQAIKYYNLALRYSTDSIDKIGIRNNQAIVYMRAKKYKNAIHILNRQINKPIVKKYSNLYARIKDNLSYTYWLNNHNFKAEDQLYEALKIREQSNDLIGQISSHAHLSEYFTEINPDKAIQHAEKMYLIAKKTNIPEDKLEALKKLISLETPGLSKKFSNLYLQLNDSLRAERNKSKNQFALIRYEVDKNKEENLKLKAENERKNYQIFKQRVIVITIIAVTLTFAIFSIFWYKKRQEKIKREIELRYSKKIHDEVANGIYHLMAQLENQPNLERKNILDDLEEIYNKSRNISHDVDFKMVLKKDYSNILKNMLRPYSSETIKIIIVGNEPQLWIKVSTKKKEELFYTLQELMTNMKKHSHADFITLKFKKENHEITINYYDNGIGVTKSDLNSKKGIQNMKNRITSIHGKFDIDTDDPYKKGCYIKISIPI